MSVMYVCMHVCMYVCMYVCVYACLCMYVYKYQYIARFKKLVRDHCLPPVMYYHKLVNSKLVIVALLQENCNNDDIHASLDSLCISMTEHALAGGFGESLWYVLCSSIS